MAFNINGALLEFENDGISITANSVKGLKFDSSGRVQKDNRPYFIAQGNGAAWINYSATTWHDIVIANTIVNNGSGYNTSNGRFTAPVTGIYYFMAQTYTQKNTDTSYNSYTHPLFYINGSYTSRQASSSTPYRLRSRTYNVSSYSTDTWINDIFHLTANDYINLRIYSSGVLRHYNNRDMFAGFLIG